MIPDPKTFLSNPALLDEALAGKDAREQTREMFRGKLKRGELDGTMIEIDVQDSAAPQGMFGMMPGMENQMQMQWSEYETH